MSIVVQRWRNPIRGYHDIPRGSRLLIGCGYAALVLALIATMPLGHARAMRELAGAPSPSVVAER